MQYTEKQQQAFGTRDRTLLVSAAAGSGKTAVLTKRIIDSLLDENHPTDITRLLIVTYTKAAAEDMRAKITKSLSAALAAQPENKHLAHQLMLIGSASISTIDSFYFDLVRTHFEAAGVSPTVRIADENELNAEKKDFMNRTVDTMFRDFPDFTEVSDALCNLRAEESLTELLLKIYDELSPLPEFLEALTRSADDLDAHADTPLQSGMGEVFLAQCRRYADYGRKITADFDRLIEAEEKKDALLKKYGAVHAELTEKVALLADGVEKKDYNLLRGALMTDFSRLGGSKVASGEEFENIIAAETLLRSELKKFGKDYGTFSEEEIAKSAGRTAALLRLIYEALTRYRKEFSEWKAQRELCEFNDIAHAAYHLLVGADGKPTELARAVSAEYDAVYIDEYQDVNALQDATFAAISTGRNRFMVGDIKQSIYRFRGSEPELFAEYRKSFPTFVPGEEGDCGSIVMSECFRCDEPIIDFTNTVFRFLFSRNAERIGYTPADDLNFAKPTDARAPGYTPPPCVVYCFETESKKKNDPDAQGDETKEPSSEEKAEIRLIVQRIKHLLNEKKADGTDIEPRDIAVLFRSKNNVSVLAKALITAGIPVNNTCKKNLFETPEVLCVYSLLAVIDNPLRDISLSATLRSPFFGFTLADLINIRRNADDSFSLFEALRATAKGETPLAAKCRLFEEKLTRWRALAANLPVDRLLRELYRDISVFSLAKGEKGLAAVRRGNLEQLYEYARSFEANGFQGLYRFIRFVDELMKKDPQTDEVAAAGNAVNLMTIHHSKGLEYPVCILANAGSGFSLKDTKYSFLLNGRLGCAMLLPNAGVISRAKTFWRQSLATEAATLYREEEMRVLYVAMTRARERLIVTGAISNTQANQAADYARPTAGIFASAGNSYLSWILTALKAGECGKYVTLHELKENEIKGTDNEATVPVKDTAPAAMDANVLRERFSFRYPYAHLSKLPAKLSVSRLTPQVLDVFDTDGAPSPEDLLPADAEQVLRGFERPFLEKTERTAPTAAERGTATHEFLQFCDLSKARENVPTELERLISQGFLPESARDAVRMEELQAFFESDFYERLSRAQKLWRETRFNIFLPAREFTGNTEFAAALGEEKLLVQGVIDLFFLDADGKLVLCDYKTDRLSPYELSHPTAAAKTLFDRHRQQLSYYRKAIAQIAEREPDEILIYSLPAGAALADPCGKTEV